MSNYTLDIIIKEEGNSEAYPKNLASTAKQETSTAEINGKKQKTIATVAKGQAFLIAKKVFTYEASMVGVKTGNSDAQDKINFAINTAGKIAGIAGAFAISPVVGAAALVGVVIGYAQKLDTYNVGKKWESIGLAQERLRAGSSYNRSRGGHGAY